MVNNIVETRNEKLENWAVKFHGMKKGSEVLVYNDWYGVVEDYNFTSNNEFIRVHVPTLGYDCEYAPHNVRML